MWPIVHDAFARASPAIRLQARWIAVSWLVLLALQVWDSRNASGVSGVAEFLSVLFGMTGIALFGYAHTLQRIMEEAAAQSPPEREAAGVQQVLLALPLLGFLAGAALAAAAALMAVRALLGTELALAVVGGGLYVGMLILAQQTVVRSTHTLFTHATKYAAQAADARALAAAARMQALQARMNPHFLFNALNTVASLVRTDPRTAESVVENLSDVLRRTLERSSGPGGTLGDEIDYVRAYLALEQQRLGDRLRVEWDIDPAALPTPLPPLVIQPLVENSLKHGLGSRVSGGTIRVSARRVAGRLVIVVEDDGAGFARAWREGTGLSNLRQRLQAQYGGAASLEVGGSERGGRVTVRI